MCKLCRENNAYLPSLESILSGVDFVALYYIFYTYFVKCVIGDEKWKRMVREWDGKQPFVSIKAEAFAKIVFKNNYIAWVEKEKVDSGIVTEYDIANGVESSGRKHIVEVVLPNMIIDITFAKEDKYFVVTPGDEMYSHAKAFLASSIESSLTNAKQNEYFKNREEVMPVQGSPSKKRSYKQLREYTCGKEEDENGVVYRYKGWSEKTVNQMTLYVNELKSREKERLRFQQAYKHLYQIEVRGQLKKKVIVEESSYDMLWESSDEE